MARLPSDPNPVYTVKGYISNAPQGGWDGKSGIRECGRPRLKRGHENEHPNLGPNASDVDFVLGSSIRGQPTSFSAIERGRGRDTDFSW